MLFKGGMKIKKILLSVFVVAAFGIYAASRYSGRETIYISSPSPSGNKPNLYPTGMYKDGTYTGNVADAYYGNIQVRTYIKNGKINDVQFLQHPNDRQTSVEINSNAMPILKSEAIQAQSANVDIISGATQTSQAFIESLASTLAQAK